jgi:hypothetical protein
MLTLNIGTNRKSFTADRALPIHASTAPLFATERPETRRTDLPSPSRTSPLTQEFVGLVQLGGQIDQHLPDAAAFSTRRWTVIRRA